MGFANRVLCIQGKRTTKRLISFSGQPINFSKKTKPPTGEHSGLLEHLRLIGLTFPFGMTSVYGVNYRTTRGKTVHESVFR
jgi:hypothetical protein